MKKLKNNIYKKYNKIVQKTIKNEKNIKITTKIINTFNKAKEKLNNDIKNYVNKYITNNVTNRNKNISYSQIKILKDFKNKHQNIKILNTDKNRGNLIINENDWDYINDKYMIKNNSNFVKIKIDVNSFIVKSKKELIYIITKFKHIIKDYKKVLSKLYNKTYDRIGTWSAIPKVHKFDDKGNQLKKIRPIINMKNTIITFSCTILRNYKKNMLLT